jgi:hypothetical protein
MTMMREKPVFSRVTQVLVLLGFLLSGGFDLATAQEFGHPLFRSFRMASHGPVGQVFAVAMGSPLLRALLSLSAIPAPIP